MKADSCSALGCTAVAGEDRTVVHMIARDSDEGNGVNLAFCEAHGVPFLQSWAGLLSHTARDDADVYVVTALRADQHRELLHRALSDAVAHYTATDAGHDTKGAGR